MKGIVLPAAVVVAAFWSAGAVAAPPPSASCAGIITSFEATELPPGFVGDEVSDLAGPEFGKVVSNLARSHLGSLEECASVAP